MKHEGDNLHYFNVNNIPKITIEQVKKIINKPITDDEANEIIESIYGLSFIIYNNI